VHGFCASFEPKFQLDPIPVTEVISGSNAGKLREGSIDAGIMNILRTSRTIFMEGR
jgi:hypothetical protein